MTYRAKRHTQHYAAKTKMPHLKIQRERLAGELPNHFNNDDGNGEGAGVGAGVGGDEGGDEGDNGGDEGDNEGGNGAADDGIVEGEGDMGLGDEDLELANLAAEIGPDDAGPAPDDAPWADAPHGVIGDYAPVQGIRQNPPVIINDWDEPPEESDGSDDEGENEGEGEGEGEGDPEYIEHNLPLELNPLDEPRLADDQICRILVHELGDLADEEWAGMCKSTLFIGTGRKHSSPPGHPPSYAFFAPDMARSLPRSVPALQTARRSRRLAPPPDSCEPRKRCVRLLY
ncbi:hypothetical protein FRC12_000651 [Ceratobasidium sp. 428]|nr:hypothetical protein FRC12_000651 [Ceratobasidium sp. 428]